MWTILAKLVHIGSVISEGKMKTQKLTEGQWMMHDELTKGLNNNHSLTIYIFIIIIIG
jgi:nitrogen fixation protein FixH